MKKILCTVIAIVLSLCACFTAAGCVYENPDDAPDENVTPLTEKDLNSLSYNRQPQEGDEYKDDCLYVFYKEAFKDVEGVGIKDFQVVDPIVRVVAVTYNLERIERGSKKTFTMKDYEVHPIFLLEFAEHDKEKVLRAAKRLVKLDRVLSCEPVYIYEWEDNN